MAAAHQNSPIHLCVTCWPSGLFQKSYSWPRLHSCMTNSREKICSPLGFQPVPASSTREGPRLPLFSAQALCVDGVLVKLAQGQQLPAGPVTAMAHPSAHCYWISSWGVCWVQAVPPVSDRELWHFSSLQAPGHATSSAPKCCLPFRSFPAEL